MGQLKKEIASYYGKGFKKPPYKLVCGNHFNDYSVLDFIERNSEEGICSYCKFRYQDGYVVSLEVLVEFLNEGIRYFYGEPSDEGVGYDSSEGGWQGAKVYNSYDLFSNEIFLEIDSAELEKDIVNSFSDKQWCLRDPYQLPEHQELSFDWNRFSTIVKHKVRYSFFRTTEFDSSPNKGLSQILHDIAQGVESLNLIKLLTSDLTLFRCRQHTKAEKISSFEQLTSPPDKFATQPNRMSPAGISMFYGALDEHTAKQEVIDMSRLIEQSMLTMGYFNVRESLQIIDFSSLPELPSIFDKEKRKFHYLILFFNMFAHELSKPIHQDGRQHIDYVPTQILTEYFRYVFSELTGIKIDGIMYKSSKSESGQCFVLFMDNLSSGNYLVLDKAVTEQY